MLMAPVIPPDPTTVERIRSSPLAWSLAGLLAIAATYFIIRLLELDLINEETPDQDDPLSR
ncbi:MAG TPA: hypothetical protein VFE84_04135 [Patescibacteria group bacterium]|jgi:hypothetical protein|nr:hypothetical protein [Patescibacteria group bacterium]